MAHKAGFVSILGRPNVGKSTLMNALVGEKLSAITNKAQTTRHRIKGILSREDYQIVFSDTPGIIDPHYKLHEAMMHQVEAATEDADVIVYLIEPGQKSLDEPLLEATQKAGQKLIFVINKVDTGQQDQIQALVEHWLSQLPQAEVIPIAALHNFNISKLLDAIIQMLPEHPAYYPKDELTDKSYRFLISEMIREKVLKIYRKEIPYSVEVVVDTFKEEDDITRIRALIFVARESQKMIIIGHKGKAIKQLGTDARKDIEAFLDKKVFIELTVKVDKNWRDSEQALKRFGYDV